MKKLITILIGLGLVSWGILFAVGGLVLPVFGVQATWLEPWRFWPLIIIGVGDFLAVLGLNFYRNRGMGSLFIPALPVLMVGALLLIGSVFNAWHIWATAWSLIILALALGFVLAMVTSRIVWFGIPAIVIGLNALALVFCSFTGLWHWWAALWTIEPLSVGLILLLVASQTHGKAVMIVGLSFCAFAAAAFPAMTGLVFVGSWLSRVFWPIVFLGGGAALLGWGLFGRKGAEGMR